MVLIGGGGHVRVLLGVLLRNRRSIRGIVTTNQEWLGTEVMGVPVLGEQYSTALDPREVTLANGVGNTASRNDTGLSTRAHVYTHFHRQGFTFFPLVSEQAVIQPEVTVDSGVQLMPGAVIQPGVRIGENALINTSASIDHDCVIGAHSHIAPGATLCGEVQVGAQSFIGAGAVIIQGIHIGAGAVIGAGAIITHNVPDGAVVLPAASTRLKL